MSKRKVLLLNVFLLIAFLEIALRLLPYFKTSSEKTEGKYVSYYGAVKNSWLHVWPPNSNQVIQNGKNYSYPFRSNSLGLREKEVSKQKPDSCYRIIVLGDSYAEGVGASSDSTWPDFLSKLLEKKFHRKFEVINAGVSGSDPFYEYVLLREKLMQYHPDAVIVSINTSDIYDFIYRGGRERFLPSGYTVYKKGPLFEPLYHYSFVFRLLSHTVLGYGRALIKRSDFDKWNDVATDSIAAILNTTHSLCEKNNVTFLSVVHPNGGAVSRNFQYPFLKWFGYDITANISKVNTKLSYPHHIDICNEMTSVINERNFSEYVWKSDSHYTAKGYELFASVLFHKLLSQGSSIFDIGSRTDTVLVSPKVSSNILHLSTFKNPE